MEAWYLKLAMMACALLAWLGSVTCLQCYECTSYPEDRVNRSKPGVDFGEECLSPLNTTTTPVPLNDCKDPSDPNFTARCFKLTTFHRELTDNRRMEVVYTLVSRFCGTADHRSKCWKTYGKGADTETCVCEEEGCNTASQPTSTGFGFLTLLTGAVLAHLNY